MVAGTGVRLLSETLPAGTYRPLVTRVVDFADGPFVVTDLAERRTMGRVVVRIPRLTHE